MNWAQVPIAPFERPAWYDHARCAGLGPDLFYAERGSTNLAAAAICADCPVRDLCLCFAVDRGETFGVWGGLSVRQRGTIRMRRRRAMA